MDPATQLQLEEWYAQKEDQKIVDQLQKIPRHLLEMQTVFLLAKALNNLGHYDETIDLLLSFRKQSQEHALWHYYLGYAYFYLQKKAIAFAEFSKVLELDPFNTNASYYLSCCSAPDSPPAVSTKDTFCANQKKKASAIPHNRSSIQNLSKNDPASSDNPPESVFPH